MASSNGDIIIGSASGVKTANAEWFAADLTADIESDISIIFEIHVSVSAAVVVEVTFDSGSNWTALNDGTAIGADKLRIFDIKLRSTDNFNMRTPTSGGATVDICTVDQSNGGC